MRSHIDSKVKPMPLLNPRSETHAKIPSTALRDAKHAGNALRSGQAGNLRRLLVWRRIKAAGASRNFARLSIACCSFALVFCWVPSETARASEEVVYKANLPLKPIVAQQTAEEGPAKGEEKKYFYDPTGKTDPFKSFIAEQEEMAEKIKRKPRTYLETLDLSQLELIAIITGSRGNYAMVRDSKGVGHVIVRGTAIGTNGGVVEKITEKEVVIKEEYQDFKGATKFKEVSKKLPSLM